MESRHGGPAGVGRWPFEDRAAVFLKAADLLAGPWRHARQRRDDAGPEQDGHQAEIDSACELIDFLRFNVHFAERIYREQPSRRRACGTGSTTGRSRGSSTPSRRSTSPRSAATCPRRRRSWATSCSGSRRPRRCAQQLALLSACWRKPGCRPASSTSSPATRRAVSDVLLADRMLAGIHFTGSTAVFRTLWQTAWRRTWRSYRGYPRHRGRDRRQGFRSRPRERRRGRAGGGAGPRRVRVPGAEVQRGVAGVHPRHALARRPRPDGGR